MKPPYISIIVANYNGEFYLPTCLNSVLGSDFKDFELFLIDDGSTDRSVDIINLFIKKDKIIKKDKRIFLLKNKKNIGAAASRNRALGLTKGKIIIFLDNDTEVSKDWIGKLIYPLLREKKVGAAQALLLDFKDRKKIQMAGGLLIPFVGWLVALNHKDVYGKIRDRLVQREIVGISAALAVKREVIDKIGGFDEKEALYTEDLDFCWRIWVAGYKIVLSPRSNIFHWTKSVEQRGGMGVSYKQIYFHLAKNSFRSILKNYDLGNVLKYLPVSILINISRGFFILLSKRRPDALTGSLKAVIWLLFNLFDTLKARAVVQTTRKFSDEYLMKRIFATENLIQIYNKYFK